jgi:hypothetical protein
VRHPTLSSWKNNKVNSTEYAPRNIQKIYEKFRRRSTPGYFCGPKFDEEWYKLSKLLESAKACPTIYLESLFEGWGSTPFPPQLCSPRARQIYEKYLHSGQTVGEKEFMHQVKLVHESLRIYAKNKENSLDEVLLLDFLPIKAYIRVLLCGEEVLAEIYRKYGKLAYAEIKSNPSIEKYIKENYVSRYQRLFPQRLSKIDSGSHDSLPEPTSTSSIREGVPKRRRLANS